MIDTTLPKLLLQNYQKHGDKISLREKTLGIWKSYSWKDYYLNVKYIALGIHSLGLKAEDKVAIIGDNRPQWFWAELAAQTLRAVALGIFPDSTASEIKYLLEHSNSRIVVVRDQEQVDKILQIKGELPWLIRAIYWEPKGLKNYQDPLLLDLAQVIQMGKEIEANEPGLFEKKIAETSAEDLMLIMYTSGTSGLPKGAMINHRAFIQCSIQQNKLINATDKDRHLSFLPPAWIVEQSNGLLPNLLFGLQVFFPEKPETVQMDMREIAPTIFLTAPRIWENMSSTIQAKILDTSTLKRILYNLLLPVGYKYGSFYFEKRKPTLLWRILHKIADWMLFRAIRDNFGLSHVRNAFTAGAALGSEVFLFFRAIGVNIRQVYGLTETLMVTCHRNEDVKFDTVGPPIEDVQVKINDKGEIMVKSPWTFCGYYKDPVKTNQMIEEGWLHTGDMGLIDEEGHIICMERMADVIKLKDGSYFSPSFIENRLKFSPYIKDAVVFGGGDTPYVTALVIIDMENVGRWAESKKLPYTTFTDLSQKAPVYKLIEKDISRANRILPQAVRLKRFANLHKELDPDEAELTRTRKIRRSFFEERYGELVKALYGNESEVKAEAQVKYRDGRTGITRTTIKIETVE